MAYMSSGLPERFSLLLLEPAEIYFEDFSVYYYPDLLKNEKESEQRRQKGRLKICSKSLVFEPVDFKYPLLKFSLCDCSKIEEKEENLFSKIHGIYVYSTQVIEMLESNILAPYKCKKVKNKKFLFSPNFGTVENYLPQIQQLKRASTLGKADQASMIATIVCSIQNRVKFDLAWVDSLFERKVLEIQANRITPLVMNPGRIYLTDSRLYFQPYNNAEQWLVLKIKLSDITQIIPRRFLLRQVGLEIYCKDSAPLRHLFLSFKNNTDRDKFYHYLKEQIGSSLNNIDKENMTLLWQNRQVSNYEYLLYLNSLADRSFNDLTQYPVFPWVLNDYTSNILDLSNKSIYRDLSKPIGALNPIRLERLKERRLEMLEMDQPDFLYGSHYSTPGFVLYYLVRKLPEYMLCLQSGRFDHPDRMFNSVPCTWKNVIENTSDFKELIPEFYDEESDGNFLVNVKNLNFGMRSEGIRVGDVELPPWAKNPKDFVTKMRQALESEYVSQNLHHWIDLMFGYKQRDEEAVKANNVFHPCTYEGIVDLDSIQDLNERYAKEVQIMEYGQTPKQIFSLPHPKKGDAALPIGFNPEPIEEEEEPTLEETLKRKMSIHIWESLSDLELVAQYRLHKDKVSGISITSDHKFIFSVSLDHQLKVYSMESKQQIRSANVCHMGLSSCCLLGDNTTLAIGSWNNSIYIYNLTYGSINNVNPSHEDAVSQLCCKGNLLVTGSWDCTAKLWDHSRPKSPEILAELEHDASIMCVDINLNVNLIVTGTKSGEIYFWSTNCGAQIQQQSVHNSAVNSIAFSLDGRKVASCDQSKMIKVIDSETGTTIFSKNSDAEICCLCWDGRTLLAGSTTGHIQIWDMTKGILNKTIDAHVGNKRGVSSLCVSEDGNLIVSGGYDGVVKIWQT